MVRKVALGVICISLAALFVRLGIWQLERSRERKATNVEIRAALRQPAIVLDATRAAEVAGSRRWEYRRVEGTGRYDDSRQLVVRGRAWQGSPGVELVTPFILEEGGEVWVNRGWVPSPDAARVDQERFRESGLLRVRGFLRSPRAGEPGGDPETPCTGSDVQSRGRDTEEGGCGLIVQQLPDPALPRYPLRRAEPELGGGPHLTYAIQWFAFAAIAIVGYLAYLSTRESLGAGRRLKELRPGPSGGSPPKDG
jgi:surfeit locus 1 family protein